MLLCSLSYLIFISINIIFKTNDIVIVTIIDSESIRKPYIIINRLPKILINRNK